MNNHIPEQWKNKIREYTKKVSGDERDYLEAGDFDPRKIVYVKFPDGSSMFLRYAFYIVDRKTKEIAIFTEHCRYYFFKTHDLEYKLLETVESEADVYIEGS